MIDQTVHQERVLVLGASRGTGKLIVNRLLRDGFTVRAGARNVEKARDELHRDVEVLRTDVTKPETLAAAMRDVTHVIHTVGVTKRPASERSIIDVEYEGVKNVLAAARDESLKGRFLYMTAIGIRHASLLSAGLNLIKGNTLVWRRRAEDEIRKSGLDYTIIRAGILQNAPPDVHTIDIAQQDYPMELQYRIGRHDAAEVFVRALQHPATSRTTFDAVWSRRPPPTDWAQLFSALVPDSVIAEGNPA